MDKILFDDKTGKVLVAVHISDTSIFQHNDGGLPSMEITDHPDREKILKNPEEFKVVKQGNGFRAEEKNDMEKKADKDAREKLKPVQLDGDPMIKALQKQVDDLQKQIDQLKKKP